MNIYSLKDLNIDGIVSESVEYENLLLRKRVAGLLRDIKKLREEKRDLKNINISIIRENLSMYIFIKELKSKNII